MLELISMLFLMLLALGALAVMMAVFVGPVLIIPPLMARHRNQQLADQLGLQITFTRSGFNLNPMASGLVRGRPVRFFRHLIGDEARTRIKVTDLRVGCNPGPLRAVFAPHNVLHSGPGAWESGDPAFDRDVIIRTRQGERMGEVLTPALREALLVWAKRAPSAAWMELLAGEIAHHDPGVVATHNELLHHIKVHDLLQDLARGVEA